MFVHEMTDEQLETAITQAQRALYRADTDAIADGWSARLETLYQERDDRREAALLSSEHLGHYDAISDTWSDEAYY